MKKMLITGGTVFVSKYTAAYFSKKGYDVSVLNRGSKPQVENVRWICADRDDLKDCLKKESFDCIIDVCAYQKKDIENIIYAIGDFGDYLMVSSSAVYPETNLQPFSENQITGKNKFWGRYGTDKIEAEGCLQLMVPNAYIIRPPYLYGPMQNLYRETFVFECAMKKRKFYIPNDGSMKLQFFHVEDLCKFMEAILWKHPKEHIFNVGNEELVTLNTYVELCYQAAGVPLEKVYVTYHKNQRDYFSFLDYEYALDIERQKKLLLDTKCLKEGLKESFEWYLNHQQDFRKKDYINYIDKYLSGKHTEMPGGK